MDKSIFNRVDSKSVPPKSENYGNTMGRSFHRQGSMKNFQPSGLKVQFDDNFPSVLHGNSSITHSKNLETSTTSIIEITKQLKIIIQHINSSLERAIFHQEKDIINRLRYFSNTLQKELDILLKKIEDISLKTNRDDNTKDLDRQVELYKQEINKLYITIDENSKNFQELKRKYKELQDEKIFLQERLKEAIQENKTIQKENLSLVDELKTLRIKYQQNEKQINELIENKSPTVHHNKTKSIQLDSNKAILVEVDLTSGSHEVSPKKSDKFNEIVCKIVEENMDKDKNINSEKLIEAFTMHIRKIENTKHVAMEKLKAALELERKEKMKLNNYISANLAEINDYEMLFIECVKAVKTEIYNRAIMNNSNSTSNNPSNNGNILNHDISNIKNFLSLDKYKILELFVTTEKVLFSIYELMFPYNKSELNELIKQQFIMENNDNHQDYGIKPNNILSNSDIIDEQYGRLQGDKSDFNQTYHFENLMMLRKNKQDFQNMMMSTSVSSYAFQKKKSNDNLNRY